MPRNIPSAINSEIASEQNAPVELYEVYLDDQTYYFANAEQDIVLGSQTYTALGISRTRISTSMDSKVDEINIQLDNVNKNFSDAIQSRDFQGRQLIVKKAFRGYLNNSQNIIAIFDGRIDSITLDQQKFVLRVVSWLDAVTKKYPGRVFQTQCNYKFGDAWCTVDKESSSNKATGTAESGSTASLLRCSTLNQADNYWNGGYVKISAGTNAGRGRPVKSFAVVQGASEGSWEEILNYGSSSIVMCFAEHNQNFYFGDSSGKLYRSSTGNSGSWTEVFDTNANQVGNLISYNGNIYVGVIGGTNGGKIFRSSSGNYGTWSEVYSTGETTITSFTSHGSYLYVGTGQGMAKAFRSSSGDPGTWSQVLSISAARVHCLASFGNHIYAGLQMAGKIYRSASGDSGSWNQVFEITGQVTNRIRSLASRDGYIYTAVGDGDGKVFRSSSGDSGSWTEVFDTLEERATGLISAGQDIWVMSGSNDGKIFRSASGGSGSWSEDYDTGQEHGNAFGFFNGHIYVSTNVGVKVYRKQLSSSFGEITFRLPFPVDLDVTSQFTAYRGCNKTQGNCINKFNNWGNYGGFTTIPKRPLI